MTLPTLTELKQRLEIDKNALDDEIIRQPQLYYEISEQLANAIAVRDSLKEETNTTDADLDGMWRKQLASLKGKVTEAMISNHILTSTQHETAFQAWLTAKTHADKLQALKEAFQQRSSMLRDLVSLYTANYYQTTSMKPSQAAEASHYAANREHMAKARKAK
jgi:uncharacterized membrane protein YheB (UPF0754 family)